MYKNQKRGSINHRAIAGVVTSAIILSAVSVIGVFMLAWSNTSLTQQRAELEEVFSTQMNKINEDLIFENIWFPTSPTRHVNVTLTNIGTLGLNVTEIQFVNTTDTTTFSYTDAGIVPSGSFSTNATYVWSDDEVIDLIVYTNRGNQFRTQVVAP